MVLDIEYQGHGIIKPEGRVVFVEGVLPGEIVDARETKRKRDHAFAVATAIHEPSPDRVEPFCAHFADCGGCTWQYLPYPRQAAYKHRFVADVMRRIGGIEAPHPLPIIACDRDRGYRNKLEYSFSPTRWLDSAEVEAQESIDRRALGFHVKGRFNRVIDVRECHLQSEPSGAIRDTARDLALEREISFHDPAGHNGLLRNLIVRTTRGHEVMVVLVVFEPELEVAESFLTELARRVPQISSQFVIVNPSQNDAVAGHPAHHIAGTSTIRERCGKLELLIGPTSFYQTNAAQAERLYSVVKEWAALTGGETVLDLYCGIGAIGLFIADRAGRVIGVETVTEAIEWARRNADENQIENTEFHAGDVRELLPRLASSGAGGKGAVDLVIIDPPRAGMHPEVVETLLAARIPRIIYVSCKPSTQARDLVRLRERYEIARMQPVDMFPQTFHIENVVELRLIGSSTEGG